MSHGQVRIDFSDAKNALFVRQTVAKAFGLPLDREFTWDILRSLICYPENSALPESLLIEGLPSLGVCVPDEAQHLTTFLRDLRVVYPEIKIAVLVHT